MTTPPTSETVLPTSTPSAILASTADTSSNHGAPPILTANDMVVIGGTLPKSSKHNTGRCTRLGCGSRGVLLCVHRYCMTCCQAKTLEEGKTCSYHTGMTHQQLSNGNEVGETFDDDEDDEDEEDEEEVVEGEEEDGEGEEDEDDPLDANVTFSRNLHPEWQELWASMEGRALADTNYRTIYPHFPRTESHYGFVWVCDNDGDNPEPLEIKMPSWPFFHPKELPSLARDVLLADDFYWRYDEGLQCWLRSNCFFRVNVGNTLCICAVNMTDCSEPSGSASLNVSSKPTIHPFAHTNSLDTSSSPTKRSRTSKYPSSFKYP